MARTWVEKYDPVQHQSHTKSDTAYHFYGYNVWGFRVYRLEKRCMAYTFMKHWTTAGELPMRIGSLSFNHHQIAARAERRAGELIKLEQKAGRLAKQESGRPKKPSIKGRLLKDYGLTWKDSFRAQLIFMHQDLIPVVVAKVIEVADTPS